MDKYEIVAGNFDDFDANDHQEDSMLGDLNQLDQFLKGMRESVQIKADDGIQNLNRPSVLRSGEKDPRNMQNYFSSPEKPKEHFAAKTLNFHATDKTEPANSLKSYLRRPPSA